MSEGKVEEKLEDFAKKFTDPKVIDILFWIAFPLALLLLAYAVYRYLKAKKEAK